MAQPQQQHPNNTDNGNKQKAAKYDDFTAGTSCKRQERGKLERLSLFFSLNSCFFYAGTAPGAFFTGNLLTLLLLNVQRPPQAVVSTLFALCMVEAVETPSRLLNDRGHLTEGLFYFLNCSAMKPSNNPSRQHRPNRWARLKKHLTRTRTEVYRLTREFETERGKERGI